MHLLKNSWEFFFKNYWKNYAHFIWKASIYMRNALCMSGLYFTSIFCVSVACFKDSTLHSFKQFFQVTTILSWGQLYVRHKPALRVRSAIFAYNCIKCKQSTPANRHSGYDWIFMQWIQPFECPLLRLVV